MNDIKNSLKVIYQYRMDYLKVTLLLTTVQSFVIPPFIYYFFFFILRIAGVPGITDSNLGDIFSSPIAVIMLIVLVLLILLFVYYELGFFILMAIYQLRGKDYTILKILQRLNSKAKYFISFQAIYFLVYFFLLLPIAGLSLPLTITEDLYLPHFITDELMKSTGGMWLYFIAISIIFYISARLVFALPYFIEDKSLKINTAIKKSWQFPQKRLFTMLLKWVLIIVITGFVISIIASIIMFPLFLVEKFSAEVTVFVAGLTLTILQIIGFFFAGIFQGIIAQLLVKNAFIIETKTELWQANRSQFFPKKQIIISGIVVFIFVSGFNVYAVNSTLYEPNTKIIAHRGDTMNAVENTVEAIESAAHAGADYSEIDIQETKDEKFVVFHDLTLRRLAGSSKRVADMTLKELQQIEVHSGTYSSKIATLEEIIATAKKNKIDLLIEVKLHGAESGDMVNNLIALLKKEQVTDKYLVQSLNQPIMEKIEKTDPTLKTGIILALNIGNLPKTSADFIVLEDFSINKRLLTQAKRNEKMVFVWTVNKEKLMQMYLRKNIDGIITNYPAKAIQLRTTFNENDSFMNRVKNRLTF
ncbi:glycerophosphoryl diester phosphodiesterase membrane domain-containing protein [Listeria ivanovii]|uniref:Glycerophosphodiester phosphodiesterase n=2 Tax=Listeria ivanovii TaxID=1638 RepID=A0ABS1G2U3_LISIV|nr:glycerophosphodiester phosphodiesterase [Listeria ivanovii]AIS59024.1 glycerophosphodiester phosphodiesterase [Listeria ivanovii subsp. londoniensis]MBK1961115.1 glycerophosphodiester phosphodiesterase [Listeria ivanovii subsp. londoniensis]MBM5607945.1 glycerophosphodiester phosphodiesterase [Listeria ivanovii]MBM5636040.1 glycerophosphodiester phosphodiesterase [Listeria ivanovii]MBM5705223.1 glycerophosphodiester phosphodiesterase [Listeria ivanovii]